MSSSVPEVLSIKLKFFARYYFGLLFERTDLEPRPITDLLLLKLTHLKLSVKSRILAVELFSRLKLNCVSSFKINGSMNSYIGLLGFSVYLGINCTGLS